LDDGVGARMFLVIFEMGFGGPSDYRYTEI
jgi:hypothetical protein